jgi:hypothetical protein
MMMFILMCLVAYGAHLAESARQAAAREALRRELIHRALNGEFSDDRD